MIKQLVAAMLVGLLASGCYVQQPLAPPPTDAAPPPPPPMQGYPPPPPPSSGGYSLGPSDYQRGVADGRAAGESAPVVGYAALGFVLGLVVAPVCLVLIAAGGGGGGGDCGSGSCYTGDENVSPPDMPPGVGGDYRAGWQKGWNETVKPRRDSAETIGFIAGAVLAIGVVIVILSVPSNRDSLHSNTSPATAAPSPGGFAIRF